MLTICKKRKSPLEPRFARKGKRFNHHALDTEGGGGKLAGHFNKVSKKVSKRNRQKESSKREELNDHPYEKGKGGREPQSSARLEKKRALLCPKTREKKAA